MKALPPMGMKRKPVMKPGSRMMAEVDSPPMVKPKKPKPIFGKGVLARLKSSI